jgi:tetratricopeptide (TPR) repeat protein
VVNQVFRNFGSSLVLLALISPIFAQGPKGRPAQTKPKTSSTTAKKPIAKSVAKSPAKPVATATPKIDPAKEKADFDAAIAAATAAEKAELLVKFIADYPKSELKIRAEESLTGARAAIAEERLTSGDREAAIRLFKLAIENAPQPYSDRLFTEVIATIPANVYWRGLKAEGIDLAKLIETHIATDVNKLLLLSTFYLGSENGDEAKRIAEAAIKLDEKSSAAHQTLATANRLNFDLEAAAASFAKAVELDPESTVAKRSLADMKRATGKADEAEKIYREILATNEKDNQARTGLVLTLFDLGKRADAEAEMAKALEESPGNVVLLGGAAYAYAANKDGAKAVEYARRAIEKEPRYIWSHIALGRGLMLQGKPVEAEQVLVSARKFGNFPTLQYEIASARLAAGFFRDAAEELEKSFEIKDGAVSTKLGGRIEQSADSFTKAIDMERRASIFAPNAADSAEDAARLKALLEFSDRISVDTKDEPAIVAAAESFAGGSDNMSVHRKLYAANILLQNGVATDEAVKLSTAAVAGLDRSLDVPNPGAAVMASELYEARNTSFSRDDFLLIPDVPKQTLSSLMRGRVEQTTGLALLQQGKAADATVRFRRALTVLPKDSAWWRSAMWNLGNSLAAEGKDKEALDTMIASYTIDKPNPTRYILIEQLWTKVNGNRDGLEEKIGPNPFPNFTAAANRETTPETSPSPTVETAAPTETEVKAIATPEVSPTPTVSPESEVTPETIKPTPTPESSPSPEVVVEAAKVTPSPELSPTPEIAAEIIKATPTPETNPTPTESLTPETAVETAKPSPTPEVVSVESPTPEASPEIATPSPTPSENTVAKSESKKPLFEPIVITIPKRATEKKPTPEPSPTEEPKTDEETKKTDEPPTSGGEIARPRIIEGKAIVGELLPCEIGVSQESVSLINNGGSISMLVSIEKGEDIKLVTGVSSSPADVEVRLEPELVDVSGRTMFVIKSVSEKTGIYQVAFKAPCGKKDVIVRVR